MNCLKIVLCVCFLCVFAWCGDRQSGIPNLKFGVVSDVHVMVDRNGGIDGMTWEKALRWFDEKKVDAVVCAGDMVQFGQVDEFEAFISVWNRVFPGNAGGEGRHVEPVFIYGNHDLDGWVFGTGNDEAKKNYQYEHSIAKNVTEAWKNCMGEDFAPYFVKDVKGYKFLGLHWGEEAKISEALAANADELNGDKPFFVVQHPVLKNTVNGEWCWGQDEGAASDVLSGYPNAVALCGHSHRPLNDETSIWQEGFTVIGTSSLREVEPRRGRENRPYWGAPVSQMKTIAGWGDEMHGMMITVYDDCLVVERMSFKDVPGKLAADWVIPWPNDGTFSFAYRAAQFARHLPEFAPGAEEQIRVAKILGKNERDEQTEQVVVEFPTALSGENLPMDYEVRAEKNYEDVVVVYRAKRVFAPNSWKREDIIRNVKTGRCVFGVDELPRNNYVRFAITPIDYFGNRGKTIYSACENWTK